MDSAKKSGQENDEIFDDSNQEEELEEDESDYKIWKKNAPYLYDTLIDVSSVNVNLFQTTLWTTELVSIFLSLRTLFLKNTINQYKFDF